VVFAFDDDESKNQMKLFLDNENFDICCIDTFNDLDTKITQEKADLILAEFRDNEAVRLCQKIKENGATCTIQWLFLIEPQELENLNHEKVGAIDDFLVKPVNIHELRARITHLVRKKKFLDKELSNSKNDFITAITDAPTGIYNRTYFYYILTNEIKRSQRYGQSLALVMTKNSFDPLEDDKDRDGYFKTIAETFKSNLREIDFVARYSDDTLALILPYTDHEGAQKALGRIQSVLALNGPLTSESGNLVTHTFTFGIASLPEDAETMVEIMEKVKTEIA
jgi:two-component system cell cycle response regulator